MSAAAVAVVYVLVGIAGSVYGITINRGVARELVAVYGLGPTVFGLLAGTLLACVAWPCLWPTYWWLGRRRVRASRR